MLVGDFVFGLCFDVMYFGIGVLIIFDDFMEVVVVIVSGVMVFFYILVIGMKFYLVKDFGFVGVVIVLVGLYCLQFSLQFLLEDDGLVVDVLQCLFCWGFRYFLRG